MQKADTRKKKKQNRTEQGNQKVCCTLEVLEAMRTHHCLRSKLSMSVTGKVIAVVLCLLLFAHAACAAVNVAEKATVSSAGNSGEEAVAGMAGTRSVVESRLLAVDLGAEWLKAAVLQFETLPTATAAASASVQLVLNDQSHRKSEPCVAFRFFRTANGTYERERVFAASAAALEPRFPLQVVCNPSVLLGQALVGVSGESSRSPDGESGLHAPLDALGMVRNTVVDLPTRTDAAGSARAGLAVAIPTPAAGEAEVYTAEELVGMILGYAKRMAEHGDAEVNRLTEKEKVARRVLAMEAGSPHAEDADADEAENSPVRYAVLTVPTFASLAQRQAMVDAAALAGLRVVRLVHSASAAAVQLAQLRAEQLFTSPAAAASGTTYVLIYDMGSRQTEAAVYAFTSNKASPGAPLRVARVTLKALAADHTLGGEAFDRCIADYWDAQFLNHRIFGPVAEDAVTRQQQQKAQVSLLRAAHRAREVLSVNREAVVHVEGVAATTTSPAPFSTVLSRDMFNDICASLFVKAAAVRDAAAQELLHALQQEQQEEAAAAARDGAALTGTRPLDIIDHIEVIGGATRMPRLLHTLGQGTRHGVGRRLNGDEAPVLGAVYLGAQSAHFPLAGAVSVSEWLTNDIDFVVRAMAPSSSPDTPPPPTPSSASSPALDSAATAENATEVPSSLLFAKRTTMLPAVKSVRLRDPRVTANDFEFDFISPTPALATSAGEAAGGNVAAGYRQTYMVSGVSAAATRAVEWQQLSTFTTQLTQQDAQIESSEVVVETAVSESGLPSVRRAYLSVVLAKTKTELAPLQESHAETPSFTPKVDAPTETDDEAMREPVPEGEPPKTAPHEAGEAIARGEGNVTTQKVVRVFELGVQPRDSPPLEQHTLNGVATAGVSSMRAMNMNTAELARSKRTLAALQRSDDERWLRSALANDIETLILQVKGRPDWEDAVQRGDGWATAVQDLSLWLEDYGDVASIEQLKARKQDATVLVARE